MISFKSSSNVIHFPSLGFASDVCVPGVYLDTAVCTPNLPPQPVHAQWTGWTAGGRREQFSGAERSEVEQKGVVWCGYLKVLAALHEILDVINGREKEVEDVEELVFLLGKPGVRQQLHQVAEVIAAARGNRTHGHTHQSSTSINAPH